MLILQPICTAPLQFMPVILLWQFMPLWYTGPIVILCLPLFSVRELSLAFTHDSVQVAGNGRGGLMAESCYAPAIPASSKPDCSNDGGNG